MSHLDSRPSTRLEKSDYLEHLERESLRFRDVLAAADPGPPVPSCPAWMAGDLLWHLAGVQHFWSWVVTTRPEDAEAYDEPKRPDTSEDVLAFFDTASAALRAALSTAEPKDLAGRGRTTRRWAS